jgi:hypothetical protein
MGSCPPLRRPSGRTDTARRDRRAAAPDAPDALSAALDALCQSGANGPRSTVRDAVPSRPAETDREPVPAVDGDDREGQSDALPRREVPLHLDIDVVGRPGLGQERQGLRPSEGGSLSPRVTWRLGSSARPWEHVTLQDEERLDPVADRPGAPRSRWPGCSGRASSRRRWADLWRIVRDPRGEGVRRDPDLLERVVGDPHLLHRPLSLRCVIDGRRGGLASTISTQPARWESTARRRPPRGAVGRRPPCRRAAARSHPSRGS